jgi:copper oxidase (laccase) domain-containing protein
MAEQMRLPFGRPADTVFAYVDESVEVRSYGDLFDYDPKDKTDLAPQKHVIDHLARAPATKAWCVLWQRLANDRCPEDRFKVRRFKGTPAHREQFVSMAPDRCDGIILDQAEDAVAMTSRDCPILVLYRRSGGPVAVLHCSRSSLTGIDRGEPHRSVIHEACALLGKEFGNAHDVCAILTMGIAAEHFPNEDHPKIIQGLERQYEGKGVIGGSKERPTIDLVALVKAQLEGYGISPNRVIHDGLDTYTNPDLASRRAKRGGHNLTLVLRRR